MLFRSTFEILFNKAKFSGLPAELQAVVRTAVDAASSDMSWKAMDRYSKDLEAIKAAKVTVTKTRSEERRVGKECRAGWWPYH